MPSRCVRQSIATPFISPKGFAFEFNYKWAHTICAEGLFETRLPDQEDELALPPYKYLPELEARSNFGALQS